MGRKLFVGNISFETTDADLREAFSRVGTIESASVVMDRATGRSRGFAFVEMSTEDEARQAIAALNGTELRGRSINVSEARERGARPGGFRPGGRPPDYGPPVDGPRGGFRKEGGSRRGVRARKRSL
jgi:RNA recognition motif-containing protein